MDLVFFFLLKKKFLFSNFLYVISKKKKGNMNNTLLPFERLTGRENFTNWKIGAKAYLITKGYYSEMCQGLATDAKPEVCAKNQKALAELTLLVDPCVYSHLEECDLDGML